MDGGAVGVMATLNIKFYSLGAHKNASRHPSKD
jgi:hypothetical protein